MADSDLLHKLATDSEYSRHLFFIRICLGVIVFVLLGNNANILSSESLVLGDLDSITTSLKDHS